MVFWLTEILLFFPLFASVVHIRTLLQLLPEAGPFSCIVFLHGWYCMARLFYIRLQGVVGHVSFRRGKQATPGSEL